MNDDKKFLRILYSLNKTKININKKTNFVYILRFLIFNHIISNKCSRRKLELGNPKICVEFCQNMYSCVNILRFTYTLIHVLNICSQKTI